MRAVEDWIAAQPAGVHVDLRALHARITEVAPLLSVVVGTMLTYGPFRYRYASGREGTSALLSIAVRKSGISVYVDAVDGEVYVAEKAAAQLGKAKVGRSCIRFARLADLDLAAFDGVVRRAVALGGASAVQLG